MVARSLLVRLFLVRLLLLVRWRLAGLVFGFLLGCDRAMPPPNDKIPRQRTWIKKDSKKISRFSIPLMATRNILVQKMKIVQNDIGAAPQSTSHMM